MDPRLAVEHAVRTLRADDPLRPVVVVVPNRLLGVWLSRSIFADTGHMAIDFLLAHELAWRLAAPSLLAEGRARLPENVGLALLLGATDAAVAHEDTPAYLRGAAQTAGFGPAAMRTLADLASANVPAESLEALASAAADPQRLRLVARLMCGFESGLSRARLLRKPGTGEDAAHQNTAMSKASASRRVPFDAEGLVGRVGDAGGTAAAKQGLRTARIASRPRGTIGTVRGA